jgi:hypothetical protein
MNPPLNVISERVDDIVLLLQVMMQMGLPQLLKLNRKLLAHTVCRWLNRHQPHPLRFADLVS